MNNLVWSFDEEDFSYNSLHEVIEALYIIGNLTVGAEVYYGKPVKPDPTKFIDTDDILELISDRAFDFAHDWADDYPNVSKEGIEELNAFLKLWLVKYCTPKFYIVEKVKSHKITQKELNSFLK